MPLSAVKRNDKIIVSFQYANGLKTSDGKSLRGFKLLNEKGIQNTVMAFVQNNKVVIPIDNNESSKEVLYGWEPYTDANLVNGQNLPASTFKMSVQ
jgi:sialate O-acetylesterase